MIDITTVQPFNIPPEIESLQTENTQLLQRNEELAKQAKIIVYTLLAIGVLSAIIVFSLKNDRNEKEKKFN